MQRVKRDDLPWQTHLYPSLEPWCPIQEPGKEQGDIVIQLEEKEHATFQRHGRDLSMRMDISLQEALCGVK